MPIGLGQFGDVDQGEWQLKSASKRPGQLSLSNTGWADEQNALAMLTEQMLDADDSASVDDMIMTDYVTTEMLADSPVGSMRGRNLTFRT